MAEEVIPFLFGWKLAEIVVVDDRLGIRSGTAGVRVGVDEAAHCFKHNEHDPPVRTCSCGFFALERAEALVLYARYPYSQLLEVELSDEAETLAGIVLESLFGPDQKVRGYVDWVRASLLANGLAPASIPASAINDVLSILIATNRTVPPSRFVDACRAARDRDSLERLV